MTDEVWTRNEPDSPCVKVCVIHDESGYCIGCKRTRDEIANWSTSSKDERQAVMANLASRTLGTVRKARQRSSRRRS